MTLAYLATPYSHPDESIRDIRWQVVTRIAAELMCAGQLIYSPISHTHHMAKLYGLPTAWEFWEQHDTAILRACRKLIVLQQDGWQESVGVNAEIRIARELYIDVEYLEHKQ